MNEQIPIKQVLREDGCLRVHSIFSTIQGEGIFAGRSAFFIRLSGCNLKCPKCDTDYTGGELQAVEDVLFILRQLGAKTDNLVVITGGEPFAQNIGPLVESLIFGHGFTVQVETNGTLAPTLSPTTLASNLFYIMCSPKVKKLHSDLVEHISAYKYVVDADYMDTDGLPLTVLGMKSPAAKPVGNKPIYIQPVDVQDEKENARHLVAAINSVKLHNYILCIQIHKIIGVE